MVLSAGADGLSADQWHLVTVALHRALALTLRPLHLLMAAFQADSDNFYGDLGQVKVAARRDCTGRESDRLRQLAHQVSGAAVPLPVSPSAVLPPLPRSFPGSGKRT